MEPMHAPDLIPCGGPLHFLGCPTMCYMRPVLGGLGAPFAVLHFNASDYGIKPFRLGVSCPFMMAMILGRREDYRSGKIVSCTASTKQKYKLQYFLGYSWEALCP